MLFIYKNIYRKKRQLFTNCYLFAKVFWFFSNKYINKNLCAGKELPDFCAETIVCTYIFCIISIGFNIIVPCNIYCPFIMEILGNDNIRCLPEDFFCSYY